MSSLVLPLTRRNRQTYLKNAEDNDMSFVVHRRMTIADVNSGAFPILPAIYGWKYRPQFMMMLAEGGAVGAATTVDILGTQAAASVKLAAVAIAALTQNTLVRAGDANFTILAAAASFNDCDPNTAIIASKTGASITTATHIHFFMTYTLVRA